ncbi:hypothetical protein DFH08DRAFT_800155 [Mycena albidolilacea]|uniref:Uncharacterized protein n=1 Tax=Mycena albidolilacea TaxID=1033008 RepID=A0AAD7AJE5_9AGAR|nr:hypothetical protein DFH08DRAFT_800155 [Mycena albidolilacea]
MPNLANPGPVMGAINSPCGLPAPGATSAGVLQYQSSPVHLLFTPSTYSSYTISVSRSASSSHNSCTGSIPRLRNISYRASMSRRTTIHTYICLMSPPSNPNPSHFPGPTLLPRTTYFGWLAPLEAAAAGATHTYRVVSADWPPMTCFGHAAAGHLGDRYGGAAARTLTQASPRSHLSGGRAHLAVRAHLAGWILGGNAEAHATHPLAERYGAAERCAGAAATRLGLMCDLVYCLWVVYAPPCGRQRCVRQGQSGNSP